MPSAHVPPPKFLSQPLWPACPSCGSTLRVISIEPHDKYRNLDVRNFACDCGLTTSDTFARP